MVNLILPCAGQSSRFNGRPKWLLTHPTGKLMFQRAISGIKSQIAQIHMVVLQEHYNKYKLDDDTIKSAINEVVDADVIVHKIVESKSQAHTVYAGAMAIGNNCPTLVKDCDNYWTAPYNGENTIHYHKVMPSDEINNLQQKSFVIADSNEKVNAFVEKKVVSDMIGVGGYGFDSVTTLIKLFESYGVASDDKELYLSEIINSAILRGIKFTATRVADYEDYGTLQAWQKHCAEYKTLIVDIDGVLVENGAKYFGKRWATTPPLAENLATLKRLNPDRTRFIFVTARDETYRFETQIQLSKLGLPCHALIMGVYHAQRVLINDWSQPTAPWPTALAINVPRDHDGSLSGPL